jgi:hypothetical protein
MASSAAAPGGRDGTGRAGWQSSGAAARPPTSVGFKSFEIDKHHFAFAKFDFDAKF